MKTWALFLTLLVTVRCAGGGDVSQGAEGLGKSLLSKWERSDGVSYDLRGGKVPGVFPMLVNTGAECVVIAAVEGTETEGTIRMVLSTSSSQPSNCGGFNGQTLNFTKIDDVLNLAGQQYR
jgi:hypothetical protein